MTLGTDRGPFILGVAGQGAFKERLCRQADRQEDGTKVDGGVSQPGVGPMLAEAKASAQWCDRGLGLHQRPVCQPGPAQWRATLCRQPGVRAPTSSTGWRRMSARPGAAQQGHAEPAARQISEAGIGVKAANIRRAAADSALIGLVRWRVRQSARSAAASWPGSQSEGLYDHGKRLSMH